MLWLASSLLDNRSTSGATDSEGSADVISRETCPEPDVVQADAIDPQLFAHNGFMQFRPCNPQTMTISMRGSVVDSHGAYVIIAQGLNTVWEGYVAGERVIEVSLIPQEWVMVAFVNSEASGMERRSLWIDSIEFRQH